MVIKQIIFLFIGLLFIHSDIHSQKNSILEKRRLIYQNTFTKSQMKEWRMEGPGEIKFENGCMEMYSPNKKWDHVFWCPVDFPESFIAEREMQNRDTMEGLTIIFFAAKGSQGQDIFDPGMPVRDALSNTIIKGRSIVITFLITLIIPKNLRETILTCGKTQCLPCCKQKKKVFQKNSTAIHHIQLIKN